MEWSAVAERSGAPCAWVAPPGHHTTTAGCGSTCRRGGRRQVVPRLAVCDADAARLPGCFPATQRAARPWVPYSPRCLIRATKQQGLHPNPQTEELQLASGPRARARQTVTCGRAKFKAPTILLLLHSRVRNHSYGQYPDKSCYVHRPHSCASPHIQTLLPHVPSTCALCGAAVPRRQHASNGPALERPAWASVCTSQQDSTQAHCNEKRTRSF